MHKAVNLWSSQALPCFSVIMSDKHISSPVGTAMIVKNHIGCGFIKFRGFHMGDVGCRRNLPFSTAGQRFGNQFPILASILSQLNIPIIGANPDHSFLHGAWSNAHDSGVIFSIGHIQGQTPAFRLFLFFRIIGSQIRTDDLPGSPLIRAAVDKLTSKVDSGRLKRIHGKTCIPVIPVLDIGFSGHDIPACSH